MFDGLQIIIFSQWTGYLDLIERYLKQEGYDSIQSALLFYCPVLSRILIFRFALSLAATQVHRQDLVSRSD